MTLYFGPRDKPVKRKFLVKMNVELAQYLTRFLDMIKEYNLNQKQGQRDPDEPSAKHKSKHKKTHKRSGSGKGNVSLVPDNDLHLDLTKLEPDTSPSRGKLLPNFSAHPSALHLTQRNRGASISTYTNMREVNSAPKEPESLAASMKISWANM